MLLLILIQRVVETSLLGFELHRRIEMAPGILDSFGSLAISEHTL